MSKSTSEGGVKCLFRNNVVDVSGGELRQLNSLLIRLKMP